MALGSGNKRLLGTIVQPNNLLSFSFLAIASERRTCRKLLATGCKLNLLDWPLKKILMICAAYWGLGMIGISWAYYSDTKNGSQRTFFKKESENPFVNYFVVPLAIGFMISLCLIIVASPVILVFF